MLFLFLSVPCKLLQSNIKADLCHSKMTNVTVTVFYIEKNS